MNKNSERISLNDKYSDKIHISFSEFRLFNNCAHKHLIERHLKISKPPVTVNLIFGDSIHETLEKTFRDSIGTKSRIDYFKSRFTKEMMDNMNSIPGFKNELNNFLKQGEDLLRILSIEGIIKRYKVVSIEEPILEDIQYNYAFKGIIDLVLKDRETGKYVIVDWKTSSQKWNLTKKLNDKIFMSQMRFYKYFWSRKNNISLDDVECRYIVLNRLKNKKKSNSGCGGILEVDIKSSENDIFESLYMLGDTLRDIHIYKKFPKVKHTGNEFMGCMFCQFKGGRHPLCNKDKNQYNQLLIQHKSNQ